MENYHQLLVSQDHSETGSIMKVIIELSFDIAHPDQSMKNFSQFLMFCQNTKNANSCPNSDWLRWLDSKDASEVALSNSFGS